MKRCGKKLIFVYNQIKVILILAPMLRAFYKKGIVEAGCDEAGRGCLAGPVFAAAVILPLDFRPKDLNDSKKLTAEQRNRLRKIIEQKATAWAVASCTNEEIDELNILNASILAMHKALEKLSLTPQFILVDGNRFKSYGSIEHACIIEGDAKFRSIAAASILAKTHRDEYMQQLHQLHPQYGWNTNKAYATGFHIQAIKKYGYCNLHRKTFHLRPKQMEFHFEENLSY